MQKENLFQRIEKFEPVLPNQYKILIFSKSKDLNDLSLSPRSLTITNNKVLNAFDLQFPDLVQFPATAL